MKHRENAHTCGSCESCEATEQLALYSMRHDIIISGTEAAKQRSDAGTYTVCGTITGSDPHLSGKEKENDGKFR